MVSTAVMNYLMEIVVLSVVFPVLLLIIWRFRTKKSMLPALMGAVIFIAFARLLEIIPYAVFVGFDHPLSKIIRSNVLWYTVYRGISLAILEEIGRYIAFRYLLPKYRNSRETAVTYGIGHGGMECILVTGWTGLQYYLGGTVLNNVSQVTEDFPEGMVEELTGMTVWDCVADSISGILFLGLQVGLSVLVFQAYRNEIRRKKLLAYAAGLHALVYLPVGLYLAGLVPRILSLVMQAAVVFVTFVMAVGIYWGMGRTERKPEKKNVRHTKSGGWKLAGKRLSGIDEATPEKDKSKEGVN